jgi:iron-sulfur cluster assembly protein
VCYVDFGPGKIGKTVSPAKESRMATALELTPKAVAKVKEILAQQSPQPTGLRVSVVGGGCSGFSYQMNFENETNGIDKLYEFEGLKVYVDQASLMYLKGTRIDYIETLEGAGFKFENPNVKSTCGCGSSFTV